MYRRQGVQKKGVKKKDVQKRLPAHVHTGMVQAGRDNHMVNAIQSNNVELDDRGYIYVADRAGTGMHIVKLTGDAAKAAQ